MKRLIAYLKAIGVVVSGLLIGLPLTVSGFCWLGYQFHFYFFPILIKHDTTIFTVTNFVGGTMFFFTLPVMIIAVLVVLVRAVAEWFLRG